MGLPWEGAPKTSSTLKGLNSLQDMGTDRNDADYRYCRIVYMRQLTFAKRCGLIQPRWG